jgi:hypothetical protein
VSRDDPDNLPVVSAVGGRGVSGTEKDPQLWFGKKESWLGFGPIARQGRMACYLYVLLVVVAVFTYSQLALTVFVVTFYTIVFAFVIVAKSDIMKDQTHRD